MEGKLGVLATDEGKKGLRFSDVMGEVNQESEDELPFRSECEHPEHIESQGSLIGDALNNWADEVIGKLSYTELRNLYNRIQAEKDATKAMYNMMTMYTSLTDVYDKNNNYTENILGKINENRMNNIKIEGKSINDTILDYNDQFSKIEMAVSKELEKYKDVNLSSSFLSNEYIKSIEHNIEYAKSRTCNNDIEKYENTNKLKIYDTQIELYSNRQNIVDYFMNQTYIRNKRYIRKMNQYLKGMSKKTFNTVKSNLTRWVDANMLGAFEHELRKIYKVAETDYGSGKDKIIRLFTFFYMILDKSSNSVDYNIDKTIISIIILNVSDIVSKIFDIENPEEHMKKIKKLLEIV